MTETKRRRDARNRGRESFSEQDVCRVPKRCSEKDSRPHQRQINGRLTPGRSPIESESNTVNTKFPTMEVKTYRAKTLQEALSLVRRDLGPTAAVLHTRDLRGGLWGWM